METIRTAIVLVFLLAILYGAYVVLNQPMAHPPLEVGWNEHPLEPPQLEFDSGGETPTLDLPELPSLDQASEYAAAVDPYAAPAEKPTPQLEAPPALAGEAAPDGAADLDPPSEPPPLLPDTGPVASGSPAADPPPWSGLAGAPGGPEAGDPTTSPGTPAAFAADPAPEDWRNSEGAAMQQVELPEFQGGGQTEPVSPAAPPTTTAGGNIYQGGLAGVRGAVQERTISREAPWSVPPGGSPPAADPAPPGSLDFAAGDAAPAEGVVAAGGSEDRAPELPAFGVESQPPAGVSQNAVFEKADPAPPASSGREETFAQVMNRSAELVTQGKPREALEALTPWYHRDLPDLQRRQLLEYLDPLAGRVVYSRMHLLAPAYHARDGESLQDIAERYRVPWQLLANINGLRSPHSAPAGAELKVTPGPFRAEIDLSQREMTLFVQGLYAGRFPVTLGSEPEPQPGEYQVRGRGEGHAYYSADGQKTPPLDPRNPFGRVWMDLGKGLTLHEAPGPDAVSTGCLGLSSRDAEDVYGILAVGAEVSIRP